MLDPATVHEVLKEIFPMQNDFSESDFIEEFNELNDFSITTIKQLRSILLKHKVEVLEIDREPLDDFHEKAYKEEYGDEYVDKRIKGEFWFALPGLLRITLELEFGDRYRKYANIRDGI